MGAFRSSYNELNPYQTHTNALQSVIFHPNEYQVIRMTGTLTANAMRVWFYALATMKPDGTFYIHPKNDEHKFAITAEYIRLGIRQLISMDMIARKDNNNFWINPSIARSVVLPTL